MTGIVFVYVTHPSAEAALSLGRQLVEEGLAGRTWPDQQAGEGACGGIIRISVRLGNRKVPWGVGPAFRKRFMRATTEELSTCPG